MSSGMGIFTPGFPNHFKEANLRHQGPLRTGVPDPSCVTLRGIPPSLRGVLQLTADPSIPHPRGVLIED
jgi:hypothetical protein